jgi:uncharacterized membrane protein YjjP (DUF1212 family)
MKSFQRALVNYPLLHLTFSVVFFTAFLLLLGFLPWFEGIAWFVVGPVAGALAFALSRWRMPRE